MNPAAFAPWQQRVYAQACERIDAGRLAHGLLICGPAGLGKRAVAEALARRMLCDARPEHGEACGRCRSCQLFDARVPADAAELRPDGAPVHPFGRPNHPDAMFVGQAFNEKTGKMRAEIVIEQIRELSDRLVLTPQYGRAQIALIDPAEAVNHAACNALLKTLEEPQPGRYLWLITAHPARLPATIRSRCQKLEFRLPPQAEALAWLQAQGHAAKPTAEALHAARGHPGLAHAWLSGGGLALRREVAADLDQLASGRVGAVQVAQRWTADDQAGLRLRFAADIALDFALEGAAGAGAEPDASGLTGARRTRTLAACFDAANRTRDLLRTTVRADLAVTELLLAWREATARRTGRR
ncbi:MAG TPA: DNA polymerase III subunit delta' [Xanthomonadaceae bacterium]|nr:DNA polymerase III subunit delta' [Xanthomonadaceae bacterium]